MHGEAVFEAVHPTLVGVSDDIGDDYADFSV